jgi:hypothetical protein
MSSITKLEKTDVDFALDMWRAMRWSHVMNERELGLKYEYFGIDERNILVDSTLEWHEDHILRRWITETDDWILALITLLMGLLVGFVIGLIR